MNWTKKHSFFLGQIMGKLHNEMRFSMETEEEQVYDRVIRAIETIAELEVYEVRLEDWEVDKQPPEIEEDSLH